MLEVRSGDSTKIIADIKKAKKILNWEPRCSDLDIIISTTWNVYKQNNSISKVLKTLHKVFRYCTQNRRNIYNYL